ARTNTTPPKWMKTIIHRTNRRRRIGRWFRRKWDTEAQIPNDECRMTNDVAAEPRILSTESSRWPHGLAIMLCCATFPLVWVGGLVTSYKAGMAFPDWPTSDGYFLFFYPWLDWLRGPWDLFVEHGHRLLASFVGLLTIAFCWSVFLTRQPKWL